MNDLDMARGPSKLPRGRRRRAGRTCSAALALAACWLKQRENLKLEEIDSAVKFNLDFPMGIFELADFTGMDVIHKATVELQIRDKKVIFPHPDVEKLFNEKKLGQKSG